MGGKAFISRNPLMHFPRLSPSTYQSVRDRCLRQLKTIYSRVATPETAPEKESHGDIDILVSAPKHWAIADIIANFNRVCKSATDESHLTVHARAAHRLLQSLDFIHASETGTTIFAILHPLGRNNFIQVDLQLCPEASFDWMRCFYAHGDFWQIVGHSCTPFGFSFTHSGFHLRDETIEKAEFSKRFFVTADPMAVLDLLGLDAEMFWREGGFESTEVMFKYISDMRLFVPRKFKPSEGKELNGKEKRRLADRHYYRRFCEEWVPELPDVDDEEQESRENVLEEVLTRFDKKQEWLAWRAAWWDQYWPRFMATELKKRRKERAQQEASYAEAWIEFINEHSDSDVDQGQQIRARSLDLLRVKSEELRFPYSSSA